MEQPPPQPGSGGPSWLYAAGLLSVLLVITLAFSVLRGVRSRASGPANGEGRGSVTAASASVSGSVASLAQGAEGLQTTLVSTHTVFVPSILKGYWQVSESPFGVQMYANHAEQDSVLVASAAGVRWARIPLRWSEVEPHDTTPENYEWPASYDDWLARLSAQEFTLILTVTGNPSWASAHPGGPITATAVLSELVEFMEAAVARYSAPPYRVKYWEFYNEPDNGSEFFADYEWGYWGNEPAAYAAMLQAVYQPIKEVDPGAQIVFGGLAYDWFTSEGGPFVKGFLDGVLENGGGAYFDLMNFHYYPPFRSAWDPYGPGMVGKVTCLRDKLAEYGVFRPLICTETGLWGEETADSNFELQSRAVAQLFAQGMAADLQTIIWFALVDESALSGQWGLLTSDLSPKPTFYAYQTAAEQLANAAYVRQMDIAETGSEEIEAHRFLATEGSTSIVVAWTNDEREHPLTITTSRLLLVDKYGNERSILDAEDGVRDGRVRVIIDPSPVYLRFAASTPK